MTRNLDLARRKDIDRAYVEKKDYARAAADIREFLRIAPPPENHVNHWPRMADLFESDPDIPAIGLHCTSVSEDPFRGEYNEETEEYDQPNRSDEDGTTEKRHSAGWRSFIAGRRPC